MVFFIWIFIFYYSGQANDSHEFLNFFIADTNFEKIIGGIASALPLGVFIHQISVSIKNHIIGKLCTELDDFPKSYLIEKLKSKDTVDTVNIEYVKYILERISNLNSFYYVRFDNGFLAPFLAFITILAFGYSIHCIAIVSFIVVAVILLSYLPRICKELKKYTQLIKSVKEER